MISNILIADIGMYVDENMTSLIEYKKSLKIIKTDLPLTIQVEPLVSENKDIVILSDIKAYILNVLNIIQKSNYSGNIHLILPLPFGKITNGTTQCKTLSDLTKVKSIAVYDPYKLAMKKYNGIDNDIIEKIINEQTSHLLNELESIERNIENVSNKYFFDFDKDIYIQSKSLKIVDNYETNHSNNIQSNPNFHYRNNDENPLINSAKAPSPRPDGKVICKQLKAIRKEFAKLNGIDYNFKECTYNGPCAGTCIACDNEANELGEIAKNLDNVKYPKVVVNSNDEK
ncbi:hypothetical protein [Ruminococcus bovis]|uniref:Uncharacterized protein n=1 Tax=Ruminococcus bovis TaxID=2564099 RepID=A0A4P8XYB8_9FIRM|nr:hypothetical protein [Ruminococcus bovis]QCT07199.1 hypothetical protein E5Z56_07435 [Ruminococcus bovis]